MTLAKPPNKRRKTIVLMVLSAIALPAMILVGAWNQACGTGFGTVEWQRHIFAAQKQREEGNFTDADSLLNQAFTDAKRLGPKHPFYSITLRHLSDAAFGKCDFKASKAYALQELEILKPLGEDFPDLAPVYIRLSDLAYLDGNLNEAALFINKAKVLKDKSLFNPTLKAEIKMRLALIALAENRRDEFKDLVAAAEKDWIDLVKEPKTGNNFSDYGSEVGKLSMVANKKVVAPMREAARFIGTRGVFLTQKYKGVDALAIIWALRKLGETYYISKRPLDQISCYQRGAHYAIASKILSKRDKSVVLYQYAQPLCDEGYPGEALPMLRQAELYSRSEPLEGSHMMNLQYLSICYKKLDRFEEAISCKRQLVDAFMKLGRESEAKQELREIETLTARIK